MTEIVRLGDLCHTTSGGTPSRSRPEFFGGEIPWVKSGNLNDGLVYEIDESISAEGLASSSAKIFPAGTLLIAMYGATVGRLGILGREAATNQAVCGIQPNNDIDRDFLFHCLLHKRKELVGKSVGGAQPNISQAIIRDTLVPLPPLDEQRRIVGLLDRAAEIRRRADAARAKARAIIPALFLDTFGDPATNPKGWPVVEFGKVIKVSSGNFLPAKSMSAGGIFPVYGGNGVNGYHSEFMFEDRKIVIGRVGAYCGNIHLSEPRSWITDNALYIAVFPAYFSENYLVQALKNAKLNERSSQAGQPLISAGRIATVPLLVPPHPLQIAFAEKGSRLESLARHLDDAAAKAEAMAAGLSAEVFG